MKMAVAAKVPTYAVALVVAGGAIWVFAAVASGAQVASCMSCGSVIIVPRINASSLRAAAIRSLAWDDLSANLYVATVGLLAMAIGLTAFRRGERWAWYAVAAFVAAGVFTAVLDELAWGGWFTFFFLGLVPLLGLLLSTPSFFGGRASRR